MGFMWIGWIVLLLGAALVLWLFSSTAKQRGAAGESPEAILKRRYAKGEIDRETYERMLADVRK